METIPHKGLLIIDTSWMTSREEFKHHKTAKRHALNPISESTRTSIPNIHVETGIF